MTNFFIICFTFILIINIVKCEIDNKNFLISNAADDAIGQTDYLITLYSTQTTKPCLYFSSSRYSQPESSLINCTWYKTNACCKRTEVASVFLSMYTLNGASQQCMNLMNYMMCYFCSPDQYIWYRNTKVSICLKFCYEIYDNCKNAEYGGRTIGDIYENGKQFCEAQDFLVIESNHQCFEFDSTPFSKSNRNLLSLHLSLFISFYQTFILLIR